MRPDPERIRVNVWQAPTEDLLDRATVYGAGMEPEALDIIEAELRRRGLTFEQIKAHAEQHGQQAIWLPDGMAAECHVCRRPAVVEHWDWHRLWGVLPLFPRRYYSCAEHQLDN